jgi:hypothetical protein
MTATTVLLMVGVVAVMLLVGMALVSRSRVRPSHAARGSNGDAGWFPAVFSDGGSSDCSSGDAGCDGGGGGGGD